MLNISFQELTGRAPQQVLAREMRPWRWMSAINVLQLMRKPNAPPTGRVALRPKAARQSLVQEPTVGQPRSGRGRGFPQLTAPRVCVQCLPHPIEGAARGGLIRESDGPGFWHRQYRARRRA